LSLFSHHHSIGDNLHPLSPLKTLFRSKFVLRNEYLLEGVQIVLFRIGAKIVIFCKFSPLPRLFAIQKSIIFSDFPPRFSQISGRRPPHPLAAGLRLREAVKARYEAIIIYCKSAQIRAIRGNPLLTPDSSP
jgi:hypothetical protein